MSDDSERFLYVVEKCCGCIDLKWGSLLIALFGFTGLGFMFVYVFDRPGCNLPNSLKKMEESQVVVSYLILVLVVSEICFSIPSIILLIGIAMSNRGLINIYIYLTICIVGVIILFSLLTFGLHFATLIINIDPRRCYFPYSEVIWALFSTILWIYFIIVVRSYREELEDDE